MANLTASRVSTEKVRKIRFSSPTSTFHSTINAKTPTAFTVLGDQQIGFDSFEIVKGEPLQLEVESFIQCVRSRPAPVVTGKAATRALKVALAILDKIEEHGSVVAETVSRNRATRVNISSVFI